MLGNHGKVVEAFEETARQGGPISAPSLIFLAVSHDHLGNKAQAKQYTDRLASTWPNFPCKFVIRRIFGEEARYTRDILDRLSGAMVQGNDPALSHSQQARPG